MMSVLNTELLKNYDKEYTGRLEGKSVWAGGGKRSV